ncbi:pirin family protein [Corallococcus praedator]|uniref:Pirin family protein n=1 Tax=Corallococcus praedator TaxID=2316724 RepID=A0ABX9QPM7_9BACT|nr:MULTISPECIES: pirin-like C-terminal cupin domain-containing protein [Corallococcus]RKH32817.1 pirin family protein [Corallococcus sp. CA031C]RKI13475.1 pirin family protein [Corallococcus praedator]
MTNPKQSQTVERRLGRVIDLPAPMPGQFGPAHTVVPVISPEDYALSDPFILLMDDRINGKPIGGPHPHAGFETVTLVEKGGMAHDSGRLGERDAQWMTAGSGVIHGEGLDSAGEGRILQLWLTLPKAQRWVPASYQDLPYAELPVRRESGVEVRLYSGSSGAVRSQTKNYVPVTLAEFQLEPGASIEQDLPASYNGFLYVMEGEVAVGPEGRALRPGQVGWLDRAKGGGDSSLRITGTTRARALLYAGQPQGDPLVSHGPFIGDTQADILRVMGEYRSGRYSAPPRR